MMFGIHFVRPWMGLLVLPMITLLALCYRYVSDDKRYRSLCDPHLLQHLLQAQPKQGRLGFFILLALVSLFGIFTLMGPAWTYWHVPVYQKHSARVIALDVSPSMNATDLKPSRLVRAKYKEIDLLKKIKQGDTGMVVFSGLPFVVSPLTHDTNTISSMLSNIDSNVVPVAGYNIGKALLKSASLIKQGGYRKASILLITDSPATIADQNIARTLAHKGIRTLVLGGGTAIGAPVPSLNGFATNAQGQPLIAKLPEQSLRLLAAAGNGIFIPFTNTNQDINALYKTSQISSGSITKSEQLNNQFWHDQGHIFLIVLCLLVAVFSRKGWLEAICR